MLTFADRLQKGETIYSVWSQLGSRELITQLALADFDAVVIDMQHGTHSDDTIVTCSEAIIGVGKIPITRLPVNRFDAASRALDLGFEAVIAPMINSREDAEEFASYMKYPPIGSRSWGARRANQLHHIEPGEYLQIANEKTLSFAMIETKAAYENFDEIISVDGIDGVFVGPSDFSIDYANGATVNGDMPETQRQLEEMPLRAKAAGKLSGIFAATPETSIKYAKWGYNFVNVSYDIALIKAGSDAFLKAAELTS